MFTPKNREKMVSSVVDKIKAAKGKSSSTPESEFEDEEESPVDAKSMGLESAAEEVMGALKSGNATEFASALKSFISLCGSSDYDDEE